MTDRKLMQMALKRLERTLAYSTKEMHELNNLKALLRERLNQPECPPCSHDCEQGRGCTGANT